MTRSIRFMHAYVQYFTIPIVYYFAYIVLSAGYICTVFYHSVKPVQSVSG